MAVNGKRHSNGVIIAIKWNSFYSSVSETFLLQWSSAFHYVIVPPTTEEQPRYRYELIDVYINEGFSFPMDKLN